MRPRTNSENEEHGNSCGFAWVCHSSRVCHLYLCIVAFNFPSVSTRRFDVSEAPEDNMRPRTNQIAEENKQINVI